MNSKSTFWGLLLVLVGVLILFKELIPDFDEDLIPPILMIAGGVMLIFKDKIRNLNN